MPVNTCTAFIRGGLSFHFSRCSKKAKHIHEGKAYCGIHYPPNVLERQQKQDAVYAHQRRIAALKSQTEGARREVIRQAIAYCTGEEKETLCLFMAVSLLKAAEENLDHAVNNPSS